MLTDRYLDGLPEDSRRGRQGGRDREWYEKQEAAGVSRLEQLEDDLAAATAEPLSKEELAGIDKALGE